MVLLACREERDLLTTGTNPDLLPQAEFLSVQASFIGVKRRASKIHFLAISYRDLFNEIS